MNHTPSTAETNPVDPNVAAEWAKALAEAERETAEQEAAERAAPEQAAPQVTTQVTEVPQAGKSKSILKAGLTGSLMLVCMMGAGVASVAFNGGFSDPEPGEVPTSEGEGHAPREHEHPQEHELDHEHEHDPLAEGHEIDFLIRSANFEEALLLCQTGSRSAFGSDESFLIYREGLCLEALGRWSEARRAYERAMKINPIQTTVQWARNALGLVRCALSDGDLATSRELLDQVLLRSGDATCRGQRILAECLFLRGRAELQKLGPPAPVDPFDITALAWPSLAGGIEFYLDWLPAEPPAPEHSHGKHASTQAGAHHSVEHGEHAPAAGHHESKPAHPPETKPAHDQHAAKPDTAHPPETKPEHGHPPETKLEHGQQPTKPETTHPETKHAPEREDLETNYSPPEPVHTDDKKTPTEAKPSPTAHEDKPQDDKHTKQSDNAHTDPKHPSPPTEEKPHHDPHPKKPENAHPEAKHSTPTTEDKAHHDPHPKQPENAHPEAKHPTPTTEDKAHHDPHGPVAEGRHAETQHTAELGRSGWLLPLVRLQYIRLRQTERPVVELLQAVGKEMGLALKIESAASAKLASQRASIDVDLAPTTAVLTALTRKYGLDWKIVGGSITIMPARHPDEAMMHEVAAQVIRQGLSFAMEHPRERAARITATNLDWKAGRRKSAISEYRDFLEYQPHAAESVYATYNLGLIELSSGNFSIAQSRFLDTVDRGPGTKWADLAWWWIGRTQLDTGDTVAARKPLRLAKECRTKSIAKAAELAIAACALIEGDEEEMREIIRSHQVYNQTAHASILEFFDALDRYRINPSDTRGERVAEALLAIGEGRLLGPAGYLMAGQAYREIGYHDRAAGMYDAASELVRGPLGLRMLFEAGERYDQLDYRDEARKRYKIVASLDAETWGNKAELHLAELAIRDRRGEECIRRCRSLLGREGVDSAEVLRLMGRGYEILKLYRQAAECYGGRVP